MSNYVCGSFDRKNGLPKILDPRSSSSLAVVGRLALRGSSKTSVDISPSREWSRSPPTIAFASVMARWRTNACRMRSPRFAGFAGTRSSSVSTPTESSPREGRPEVISRRVPVWFQALMSLPKIPPYQAFPTRWRCLILRSFWLPTESSRSTRRRLPTSRREPERRRDSCPRFIMFAMGCRQPLSFTEKPIRRCHLIRSKNTPKLQRRRGIDVSSHRIQTRDMDSSTMDVVGSQENSTR